LHRSSVIWWSLSVFLFALGYGTLATEVERFVSELSVLQDAIAEIGGTIIDAWLSVVVLIFAVVAAVFSVLAALRARSEENNGHAEPVLSTAVSRPGWLGSHLAVALIGSALLMSLTGLGLGISASQALGDGDMLWRVLGASLAHIPAIWLVASIAVALFGLMPRATVLVWVVIAYVGVVGWLGALLRFPDWAINLSPLGHTPLLPAEDMVWAPLVVLTVAAAVLIVAGLAGFRRRDLQSTA
jgi:ABC-2 type transport system permease protein